jgi:hypothetical protein
MAATLLIKVSVTDSITTILTALVIRLVMDSVASLDLLPVCRLVPDTGLTNGEGMPRLR